MKKTLSVLMVSGTIAAGWSPVQAEAAVNHEPAIFVHGFNGFSADNTPDGVVPYWGGHKIKLMDTLKSEGYDVHEASIGAMTSNYDRAVELYYYIKGGKVDYGAQHAAYFGHNRYGKTYPGVYKDWEPGKKVHLIGHSMGGQTIRVLEDLLRDGRPEEVAYAKEHHLEVSPLFEGHHDDMVESITTLVTPHNGTYVADNLGNKDFIKKMIYGYLRVAGNTSDKVDWGLAQWDLKQRDGESYTDYMERVRASKLWTTEDNGFYDLTTEGAAKINAYTELNPKITYKTYSSYDTHKSAVSDHQLANVTMFFPFTATGNLAGKSGPMEWWKNDGLVSAVSAVGPANQKQMKDSDTDEKGVWQVTPTKSRWDHVDFIGGDTTDRGHSAEELKGFYEDLMNDLVKSEQQ